MNQLTRSSSEKSQKEHDQPKNDDTGIPVQSNLTREIVSAFYTAKLFLPSVAAVKIVFYIQQVIQYVQFVLPLVDYGTDCSNAGTDIILFLSPVKQIIALVMNSQYLQYRYI